MKGMLSRVAAAAMVAAPAAQAQDETVVFRPSAPGPPTTATTTAG